MASVRTSRNCKATCGCERVIRVSKTVYEQGSIVCGMCWKPFQMDLADEEAIKAVRGRWPQTY